MEKLAINGGPKVRRSLFPSYDVIDQREIRAVTKVLKSGVLSRFLGAWHADFYGGPHVQSLEKEWAKFYRVKHAVSMNSATSGLIAAIGAAGISPGDEVIVTPYSMCISATAPLFYGAIPVFADIEPDFFCLNPQSVEKAITKKTRAIIVVDLFGQPYDASAINAIAKKHNLVVIEDASQAPGATYHGKYAGTLGHIGIYSLNYHKHIHSGEGGIVVTNDAAIADRLRLIRNHAEAVVEAKGETNLTNMLGFNFRMTELEAAIAREQLKKLPVLIKKRRRNVAYLEKKLRHIPFLTFAKVRSKTQHAYYVHPFLFDTAKAGVTRETYINAVKAELAPTRRREGEGVKVGSGYVKPLYLMPLFQKKICVGGYGTPFPKGARYPKGLCPVTEQLHEQTLCLHDLMHASMAKHDLDDVIAAFTKVSQQLHTLRDI